MCCGNCVQSLLTPEGELQQVFQGMPAESTMEGLHAQRMLLKLGNAVVEAQNNDWAGPGYQHLQQYLQVCAAASACAQV